MQNSSKNFQGRKGTTATVKRKSKNSEGQARESEFCQKYQNFENSILVHPQFLRSKGAGQVDCVINKVDYGIIFEIKGHIAPSYGQIQRLKNSAHILGEIFQKSFLIKSIFMK